jgi:uncharacterized protein (DUF885 family)
MRQRDLAGLTLAALVLCAATPVLAAAAPHREKASPSNSAAEARFKALYTREWTWRETELARADEGDAVAIVDHLPKVDPATQARRLAYWQDVVRQLDGIPEHDLSPTEAVNYEVYRDQIGTLISQQKFKEYEKPFNSDSSFWSNLNFTAMRTFHSADDYRAYIAQLGDVPR